MRLAAFFRRLLGRHRPSAPAGPADGPLRIACPDFDAVPPAAELAGLAVVGRHVVLQFPDGMAEQKRGLIEELAPQLPGHRVFDSGPGPGGTDCVTVYRVIDEAVVVAHLPLFLAAIADFTATARDLCRRLAAAHEIAPAELFARRQEADPWGGRVGEWGHTFHGLGCRFVNARTVQVVDVRFGFGAEFGVLDPYFLARFIRTSTSHAQAAGLLADDYHDPGRMLEVLHARGHLRKVENNAGPGGFMRRGLVMDAPGGDAQ